jgi:hypothetical protein
MRDQIACVSKEKHPELLFFTLLQFFALLIILLAFSQFYPNAELPRGLPMNEKNGVGPLEFTATIFKRSITGDRVDFEHFRKLPPDQQKLLFALLEVDENREIIFRREALALGWQGLVDAVDKADTSRDLSNMAPADSWQIYPLSRALEPLPPQEFLVEGVIPKPGIITIFGPPKQFKTLIVQELALCCASGLPWLTQMDGSGGFRTNFTGFYWIDLEIGERLLMERFSSFVRGREVPEDSPLFFTSMPSPILRADRLDDMAALLNRVTSLGVGAVVVDHLGAALGDAQESTDDVGEIMTNFRYLASDAGVTVFLIHHQTKGGGGRYGDSMDSARGHGSIIANSDLALLVKRDSKDKDIAKIIPVACRLSDDFGEIGARWTFEHEQSSKMLKTARFFSTTIISEAEKVDREIVEILQRTSDINQTELRSAVSNATGVGDYTIRQRISLLQKNGTIQFVDGPQSSKIYRLAG